MTRIERVLIVFGDGGELKGAHAEDIQIIDIGGGETMQRQLPARSMTAEDLTDIFGDASALIAQVAALTTERDTALARVAELEALTKASASGSRVIRDWEFRDRFSQQEQFGMLQAAFGGNIQAQFLLFKLQTASDGVNLDSPEVIAGVTGFFGEARAAEILA
jgi:hypothetical protein